MNSKYSYKKMEKQCLRGYHLWKRIPRQSVQVTVTKTGDYLSKTSLSQLSLLFLLSLANNDIITKSFCAALHIFGQDGDCPTLFDYQTSEKHKTITAKDITVNSIIIAFPNGGICRLFVQGHPLTKFSSTVCDMYHIRLRFTCMYMKIHYRNIYVTAPVPVCLSERLTDIIRILGEHLKSNGTLFQGIVWTK